MQSAIQPAEQTEALETEFEMKGRLSRIRMRDLALFVVVAGAVAVVVVLAGREAGLGEQAGARTDQTPPKPEAAETSLAAAEDGASQQVAPEAAGEQQEEAPEHTLQIALEAPEICETTRAEGRAVGRPVENQAGETQRNADGSVMYESVPVGWTDVAEVEVKWRISGGVGGYTLEIDGETRDGAGDYRGGSGTASVSCALEIGETFINRHGRRYHVEEPVVDSGLKTITVTARDREGALGIAAVGVYVISRVVDDRQLMLSGETYRYFGHLITVPDGINLRMGEASTGDNGVNVLSLIVDGSSPAVVVWFDEEAFTEVLREVPLSERSDGTRTLGYTRTEAARWHSLLDQLVASFDLLPNVE